MNKIILFFLVYKIFCIVHLEKHKSISMTESSGTVFLDADKFGKNSKIHLILEAYDGDLDGYIYYCFSETSSKCSFWDKLNYDKKTHSYTYDDIDEREISGYITIYYYNIKKNVSKKYLIFQYSGFRTDNDGYLLISNTKYDNIKRDKVVIWVCASIGIIITLFCFGILILICKDRKSVKSSLLTQKETKDIELYKA